MKVNYATDLEYIASMGYPLQDAKAALRASNGDRNGAILILRKGVAEKSDTAWRQELAGDWQTGVSQDLPTNAEGRGLWKSPIYCRIPSFKRNDNNEVEYQISVVLKDGRKWKVDRTYAHFCDLKIRLPLAKAAAFKNWFPAASFFFELTQVQLEARRQQLENWLYELVMSEDAMSDKYVLDMIYSFIKAHEHGGSGYVTAAQQVQRMQEINDNLGIVLDGERAAISALGIAKLPNSLLDLKAIDPTTLPALAPPINPNLKKSFPLPLPEILKAIPYTVPTKDLPQLVSMMEAIAARPGGKDKSVEQLAHDYQRDRAIIQGRRLEGHLLDVQFLIDGCKDAISALITARGHCVASQESLELLAKRALQQLSRTESAFISFTSISEMISVADGTFIVPESSLAEPVVINFRLMDKPNSNKTKAALPSSEGGQLVSPSPKSAASTSSSSAASVSPASSASPACHNPGDQLPWCIICEGQANTVYRICEGEMLITKIQLKVSYRKVFYIMINQANDVVSPPKPPSASDASSSAAVDDDDDEDVSDEAIMELLANKATQKVKISNAVDLVYKDGPTNIGVTREMHTTGRDWDR